LWQQLKDGDQGGAFRKGLSWWYARRGDNGIVWAPAAVDRAIELHRSKPFDAVIGEHSPDGGIEAASSFFRKTAVPYLIDLRDPVGILFDRNVRKYSYFRSRSRGAKLITSTTASWSKAFEAAYELPVWVVTHAYDEHEMDASEPMSFDAPTLVYAGSTYEGQRWDVVVRALAAGGKGIQFWSAGHGASRIRKAIDAEAPKLNASVLDSVPREVALSAQKGASALLLVSHHGGCVSARTFEHIASGTPVIYFPSDGSEIETRIRKSGARFRAPATETELTQVFRELAGGKVEWEQQIGEDCRRHYTRKHQAARLASILEAACFGGSYPPRLDIDVDSVPLAQWRKTAVPVG
jgi:hypothetical protein